MKKNAESLIVDSKGIGLEVNADKVNCMVMSRDQNAERSHSIKTDNSSFERVEEFRYLGAGLTNQNYIQEEINPLNAELNTIFHLLALLGAHHILHVSGLRVTSILNSGDASYHSVQDLLCSSLLSKI